MNEAVRDFVDTWGAMGGIWGISPSVARVHALLLASKRSFSLDEICEALQIAKSNASTSLKELRNWGVVRKVLVPGERKDRYVSEEDAWTMLFNIGRERKRREFDPAMSAIRAAVKRSAEAPAGVAVERLKQLEGMFSAMDAVASRALENEDSAKSLLRFLSGE